MLANPDQLFQTSSGDLPPHRRFFFDRAQALGDYLLTADPYVPEAHMHAAKLIQVRALAREVVTLAGLYRLTGDERYAERAWFFFEDSLTWTPWRVKPAAEMIYDLATGEMGVTLSYLLLWLKPWLTPERRAQLVAAAEEHVFRLYLEAAPVDIDHAHRLWWFRATMNWNSVCNGGTCALANTLHDESELAPVIATATMEGLQYYIDGLPEDGSSEESTGYWTFGNLYLYYALTAHELRTDQRHPFLDGSFYNRGLSFILDFSKDGAALGFGDSNKPGAESWMLLAAERCGKPWQKSAITRFLYEQEFDPQLVMTASQESFPTEIVAALSAENPDVELPHSEPLKVYPVNGWGIFTQGDLTLTFQAGKTQRFHSMRDALAINVAHSGVLLVESLENHPYPRGWFSRPNDDPRSQSRVLYWEDHSISKSAPCINGIGQVCLGETQWEATESSMRSDASQLYPWFMKHVLRRVALNDGGFTIEDAFQSDMEEWYEARFITVAERDDIAELEDGWRITRDGRQLEIRVQCEAPLTLLVDEQFRSIVHRGKVRLLRAVLTDPASKAVIASTLK